MADVPGVTLLALEHNTGVASGLNRAAHWARAKGLFGIIVFDQDSKPSRGFASALWATHERNPQAAVIGSRVVEAGREESGYRWVRRNPRWPVVFQRVACDGTDLSGVTMVISSGSLIELETWNRLGGFDEGLFIDYVDTDYCLKVIRSGRSIAVAAAATLSHRLGARAPGRILGRDLRPMHHAPFRHYYIARNRVRIWRRHALAVPHWALFDLCFAGLNGFRVLFLETAKWAKFKALLLGTWDGLQGKTGACPVGRLRSLQS
jgi:rhamnosyltransferase